MPCPRIREHGTHRVVLLISGPSQESVGENYGFLFSVAAFVPSISVLFARVGGTNNAPFFSARFRGLWKPDPRKKENQAGRASLHETLGFAGVFSPPLMGGAALVTSEEPGMAQSAPTDSWDEARFRITGHRRQAAHRNSGSSRAVGDGRMLTLLGLRPLGKPAEAQQSWPYSCHLARGRRSLPILSRVHHFLPAGREVLLGRHRASADQARLPKIPLPISKIVRRYPRTCGVFV